ncbi:MAG: hypothetical protein KDD82_02545, partial [Planctomycetes bacterium]|nr:hypothetical protein [Planctomycetota bacterium]
AERRRAALALLEREDLLDAAAEAMEALGYVGEDPLKRLGYLIATSRLLAKPLSAILLAPSGSGKSELLEVLTQLLPPSAVEFLSRISPAALYYAGADWLRHKLILVDESSGSADADYAVRTLQSKGFLRLAVPLKGRTEQFVARGPIALMSGTTSSTINPENLSRCLQLVLDDSAEQTQRIQRAQRAAWAGRRRDPIDLAPWRDAQSLLESLPVTIPFAEQLEFPARTTHDRRGNQKLLGLVAAHALLHQRQRARDPLQGVVATHEDYAAVYALLAPRVAGEVEGLSARAERAYRTLAAESGAKTRRELSALLGWGYNTAKRALAELEAQELVARSDSGPPVRYRLLDRSLLEAGESLVSPVALQAGSPAAGDGDAARAACHPVANGKKALRRS